MDTRISNETRQKNFEEWDNTWNLVSPAPSDQPPPANRKQHGLCRAEVSTELWTFEPWFCDPRARGICFVTATIDKQKLMAGSLGVYSKAVVCGVPESLPAAALRTCDSVEPVNLQKAREQHDQYVKVYIYLSEYQVLLPEVHWYHAFRCWGSWCRKCTWCQWMNVILTACLWRTPSLCVMEQPSLPFQVGSGLIHHWCSVLHSSIPIPFQRGFCIHSLALAVLLGGSVSVRLCLTRETSSRYGLQHMKAKRFFI